MYNLVKRLKLAISRCYKTSRVPLFSRQSLLIPTSNMFSPVLGITWVALVGMCQAGNLRGSSYSPLSIVYTVYPYYNSETLLGVLKADEESLGLSGNKVVPRETINSENVGGSRDESARDSNNRDSSRNDDSNNESASAPHRTEQQPATEITYWPPVQRGAAPKSVRLGSRATDAVLDTKNRRV